MSNDIDYVRKQFPVQAQRVTPLNIEKLAKWCGGKIKHDGNKEGNFSRDYIQVRVSQPAKPEHTQAKVGTWIVKSGRTWKVYNDTAFRKTFERSDGTPVGNNDPEQPVIVKKKGPVPTPPKNKPAAVGETGPNLAGVKVGESIETVNAEKGPVMTEVAPGVEISDGPVSFTTTATLSEEPQDVVLPEMDTTQINRIVNEAAEDPDGLGI